MDCKSNWWSFTIPDKNMATYCLGTLIRHNKRCYISVKNYNSSKGKVYTKGYVHYATPVRQNELSQSLDSMCEWVPCFVTNALQLLNLNQHCLGTSCEGLSEPHQYGRFPHQTYPVGVVEGGSSTEEMSEDVC